MQKILIIIFKCIILGWIGIHAQKVSALSYVVDELAHSSSISDGKEHPEELIKKYDSKIKEGEVKDGIFYFGFYGMQMSIPYVKFDIYRNVIPHKNTREHWKKMTAQTGGKKTAQELSKLADELGLNGYLTFRLTESYVNQRFKDSSHNARMSAIHFLLWQMGYDVLLADYKKNLAVMMPFVQETVIGMPCIMRKDTGRKYYLLLPEDYDDLVNSGTKLLTCDLPRNVGGKISDLRITGLNLPFKGKSFNLSIGKLTLSGEVNENIKNLLYRYPLMSYGDYASSWIDQELRDNLTLQIKNQLESMNKMEAINTLLLFCQHVFAYKSDDDWIGAEKPFFLEENFLYEYNDCEDRAIFLSYFVWNALGIPCQLLKYPGHVSVAVELDEEMDYGLYYDVDGKKYYSADPTWKGFMLGAIMESIEDIKPTVEKHYK